MRHNQKSAIKFAIIAALLIGAILAGATYIDPTDRSVPAEAD